MRAEKTLTNGLTIVKDFQLSTNYLVMATVRLENRSAQPLALPAQEWVVGTATPLGPRDKGEAVGVLWYNGAKTEDLGGSSYFSGGCRQAVPPLEYRGGASNVVWVAAHNQFFALAAMPQQPAQGLVIRRIDLPRPTGEEARMVATNAPTPQGYAAAMVYPALTLAPNQSLRAPDRSVRRAQGIPDPGAHWRPVQQQPRPGDELRLGRDSSPKRCCWG